MLTSVIIATHNRRESLAACLNSIFAQDVPACRYEIVVVNDGSRDGTRESLESHSRRRSMVVVEQENKGAAAARNAGARAAKGDLLLFLDDDLICDPRMLSSHLSMHAQGESRVVFGRMRHETGTPARGKAKRQAGKLLDRYYMRFDQDPRPRWPDDAWVGPNCSLPRAAFLDSGGYDEQRFARRMEDVELGLRLWKTGLAFHFAPQAVTWHLGTKSDDQSWQDAENDGAAMVALCRKHPRYRAHSLIPGFVDSPRWKPWAARAIAAFPDTTRAVVTALLGLVGTTSSNGWRLKAEDRLFGIRQSAAFLKGACREAGSWATLHRMFGSRVAVLLYHHVGAPAPAAEDASLTVSPANFERHIRWLSARGYTGITASQWLAWRSNGTPIPNKPVIITFDDGYADFARHALPVLERYGFGAVQFAITGLMNPGATWAGLPVLTAKEIVDCHRRGVEIGGHSRRHPNLTAIPESEACDEIRGAKQDLQALGITPACFAYPFGYHDPGVRDIAGNEYRLAFTCDEGLNGLSTDATSLRRTMVQPGDTLLDIRLRAALGWSPLSELRGRLRLRTRARTGWRRVWAFLGSHRLPG